MSHDVDLEFVSQDVTLSFTLPGKFVYLFSSPKGEDEPRVMLVFTREEWDQMTALVNENLPC